MDRDPFKFLKIQEMWITGNDEIGLAGDGAFENPVIIRIGSDAVDMPIRHNQFGNGCKFMQDGSHGLGRILKLGPFQDSLQLVQKRLGHNEFTVP